MSEVTRILYFSWDDFAEETKYLTAHGINLASADISFKTDTVPAQGFHEMKELRPGKKIVISYHWKKAPVNSENFNC